MNKPLAFITGASAGLGEEFARQLALDHDLVLTARNKAKLTSLAEKLPCECTVIEADLCKEKDLKMIEDLITNEFPVDLLVNNAGMGTAGEFSGLSIKGELQEIQLNINSLVRLSRAALPGMIDRQSGKLINVASLAAFLVTPLTATYSATKAFVKSFSESLAAEVAEQGIHVQALCPGLTRTEFQERAGLNVEQVPDFLWMSSETVVRESISALNTKRVVVIPGFLNDISARLSAILPGNMVGKLAEGFMKDAVHK